MITTVFFDFDGTLADSAPDLAHAANLQRQYRGMPPLPYDMLRCVASQGARGLLRVALALTPDDEDYEPTRLRFLEDYRACMTQNTALFPGIEQVFDKLEDAGLRWGIVTNKAEALSFPMFDYLQLTDRSAANVCGDTTAHPKPHPAPLLHAAKLAGVAPETCIYVGDDERDIIAGKAAGMPTVAAAYGYCVDADEVKSWDADQIALLPEDVWDAVVKIKEQAGIRKS
ncbi:HAD-IA family hydrolase [Advenella mimigardefordensis]|uniref:phosphoglycolate phosphatase n=1 Tax=Advenella mimigardefordensis (strain DSM 17166 / LMG 22922 / DPN7) TaxID=1247726 RepID=W0PBW3_ADVMD|nr:HAD-IA family hydrolase [Advenella mimigardefordensis]AHG64364.1 phosphoglycolate phosphatase [Advenella mimigardefordensis DPN7]